MLHLPTMTVAIALALAGSATTQSATPAGRIPVRVIGATDGLPRPGALIYSRLPGSKPKTVNAEGYVVVGDDAIRRLRQCTVVRTDPEGRATLDERVTNRMALVTLGGAHLASAVPEVADGVVVIRAIDLEPVGVRVFDTDGTPMRDFGVALYGGGTNLSVALTDATGRAVLAAPPGFTARLTVLPAAWAGPRLGFPTVAESLAGRRGTELRLPPHAALRFRALRGGAPCQVKTGNVTLTDPTTYDVLHSRDLRIGNTIDAVGVEFPFAALGFDFVANTNFDGRTRRLSGKGPERAGERADRDVELGYRPRLRLRLKGTKQAMQLRFTAITDRGRAAAFGRVSANGVVAVDFREGLPGGRLLRLEIDGEARAEAAGGSAAWHVVLTGDHDLTGADLDLGVVAWQPRPPQLRGLVTDDLGAPIADASVVVARESEPRAGFVVKTDAAGRFEFIGPLFRDAEGRYQRAVATARRGEQRSEPSPPAAAGADVTLTIRRAAPASATASAAAPNTPARPRVASKAPGSLVARIAALPAGVGSVQLVDAGNFSARPTTTRDASDGLREYVFEDLRPGRYTLCAISPDLGRFPVLGELDVPAGAACPDGRLQALGIMDRVVIHRLRAVDGAGVPVADVRISGPTLLRRTDGTGTARIAALRGTKTAVLIEATGMRSQRLDEVHDNQVVVLAPPGKLEVAVHGIPADVAREHIEVWVRDEVRRRFYGPRAAIGAGDVATVPMPPRGRYLVTLLVRTDSGGAGQTWTGIFRDENPLEVGKGPDQKAQVRLDDEAIRRLREAVARRR